MMLVNDVSLRGLIPGELGEGTLCAIGTALESHFNLDDGVYRAVRIYGARNAASPWRGCRNRPWSTSGGCDYG